MADVSTHVLDTSRGVPARGIRIDLHRVTGSARESVATAVTNGDGRTDTPLLSADRLLPGAYELTFYAGDYFRSLGSVDEPPFLDQVVVRFGVSDPEGRYHVPLLLSPYGYSTYRGS